MPQLSTLADRVWFALHCLPRDSHGNPPSYRVLETKHKIALATLSKTVLGTRTRHEHTTMQAIARALHVSDHWLSHGGDDGPVPTGIVPPRPGTQWITHGKLPGWQAAVDAALEEPRRGVPREAFLAGADCPVYRPIERMTPELAVAVAKYAWETSTYAEQVRYSTAEARTSSTGKPSAKVRTAKRAK